MDDQLIEFLKSQLNDLRTELAETRKEMKEVSNAFRQFELHLAKVDVQGLVQNQEHLRDRVSKFEREALTESDISELRKQVAELVTESTGRKAQMSLLKGIVAMLSAINLLLMIYLAWKRV